MIVATAGHIDHGKTTLVRALTGVDTDRLPEEKARGISIDIGFAHSRLPDGTQLGFVDVPGHERFVRNMLSGVYAIGHVLLVVAADDGVMPQTREHLAILDLLGVAGGTVVITKCDRVDAARLAEAAAQAADLLEGTALQGSPVLAVSAVTGQGMEALRQRLADVARAEAQRQSGVLARYVVDRVFTVAGSGTVVTGTVIGGAIAAGDALMITPAGLPARVRKLQRHGQSADRAAVGERCALNLAGVEPTEVARGDWLVAAEAHHPTELLDVRLRILGTEGAPLKHWTPVHLHLGAADIPARLALRRGAAVAPGESTFAQLRLQRPVHAAHSDRFILRDQSASRTLGGGVVVDPFPAARRRALRAPVLAALDGRDAAQALRELLETVPDGVVLEWLAQVHALPLAQVQAMVPPRAVVIQTGEHRAFAGAAVERLQQQVTERLRRFHAEQRSATGMELVPLQAELARTLPQDVFLALLKRMAPQAGVRLQGSRLGLVGHDATDNPRDRLTWERLRPLLMEAGAVVPSVRELSAASNVPLQSLRDLLHRKCAQGELVKITSERFALPETMDMLARKAAQTAGSRPDGQFTAAQYRDTIGTGRGLAIEILECLDRLGVTLRRADQRCMREPPAR